MTNLVPIEDHVLVKPIVEETTSASGLILPDSKEKPSRGEVVAVGEGKILDNGQRAPMEVKKGDIVHFTKYSPDELEVGEEHYLIIKHSSILALEK